MEQTMNISSDFGLPVHINNSIATPWQPSKVPELPEQGQHMGNWQKYKPELSKPVFMSLSWTGATTTV